MKTITRFSMAKFEDVAENIQSLVKDMKRSRKGLYLWGDCGVGKTHQAYAIGNYLEKEMKIRCMFYDVPSLLRFIREDYSKGGNDGEESNLDSILNFTGVLIIDDFGTDKSSDWTDEVLYAIINERYNRVYPTIFTSNLKPADLVPKYGDRLVSRIVGCTDIAEIIGEDKRLS